VNTGDKPPGRGWLTGRPRGFAGRRAGVAQLGLPGNLCQRYVTDNWGLVAIARELRTSVTTVQALLDEAGVPRRRPGWPPPPRRKSRD